MVWDARRLNSPHTQHDKRLRVRQMFDAIAPTYELVNALASLGRDRYWRREMVRLAEVKPDDVLLDVACGTGDVARAFANAPVRPRQVVGADFSKSMLGLAARRPIERGEFCQADALHIPLSDASVTIVTCAFGIRNFQDLACGLREMNRVLQPGGRAVILEFTVPTTPVLRRLYLFYFRRLLPLAATLISRDRTGAYRYLPESVLSFQGAGEIESALCAVGFDDVSVKPLTAGIVSIYVAHKRSKAVTGNAAATFDHNSRSKKE
jgi:demethylmenaquinone methyltransferase/2-methoxy-6-polyprenyl-1,4-benzoquinol methylase